MSLLGVIAIAITFSGSNAGMLAATKFHTAVSPPISQPPSYDFALQIAGKGSQVVTPLTVPPGRARINGRKGHAPYKALEAASNLGDCWPIPTGSGTLGISLASEIEVSHVGIDHIPASQSADTGHAPRSMTLWGLIDAKNSSQLIQKAIDFPTSTLQDRKIWGKFVAVPLIQFIYNIYGPYHYQLFTVPDGNRGIGLAYRFVVLEMKDNWSLTGGRTCLYKVAVYGKELD